MLLIYAFSLVGGTICNRTHEQSGRLGGRKQREFVDDDLTMGKHLTI